MSPIHGARPKLRPQTLDVALYLLIALLAAAPLWGPGIVNTRGGGDSPFLLQRTLDVADSLRHGILPVRWMGHAAYDLGYPFFNHYAALPYYISGGLTALGLNVLSALQATQTLGFVLAALAMGGWAWHVFAMLGAPQRTATLLAVAAYTFAPFHLVNVYVRGDSLSEFYAFVWYPLILWALDRVADHPTVGRVLVGGLAYGALILTHNISALIFSPFALLYAGGAGWRAHLRRTPPHRVGQRAFALLAPFVVGVALTAWFWIPALFEIRYGQLGEAFTQDYFHYANHFRGTNLVQPAPLFDYTVAASMREAGPFAMGLIQAALAMIGVVVLLVSVARRGSRAAYLTTVALLLSLLIATLMITPLSAALWAHLPLLETTQFPWRFLSVQALFAAVVTGALTLPLRAADSSRPAVGRQALLAVVTVVLLAGAALGRLQPDRLVIRPQDVTWEQLRFYESFTGNIGTTIRYEYLPADVVPRLYISEAVVDGEGRPLAEGGAEIDGELLERTPIRQAWAFDIADGPVPVAFPINWWPGWQAYVDGEPATTYPIAGSGRIGVPVPAGSHQVTLQLEATPLRRTAGAPSLLALGLCLVALARTMWRRTPERSPGIDILRKLGWLTGACLLSLIGPFGLQVAPEREAIFYDFQQMPYPHQGPISFGEARLERAEVTTGVTPGETMTVTLRWTQLPTEPLTGTLRLISPAEPRQGVPYSLATASAPLAPTTTLHLPLPDNLSRGLYLVQLRVDNVEGEVHGRTPRQGRGLGTLHIGQLRITQGPPLPADAPGIAQFRDITLHSVTATQPAADQLRLKMVWSSPGTPRNWRLSLRLLDATGRQIVQQDLQPGYGYLPTTLWNPGEAIIDYPVLPLPEGLAPGDYTLRVVSYLLATGEEGGTVDVPIQLDTPALYNLHTDACEQTRKGATILCQTGEIALIGLEAPAELTEGADLTLQAEWNALLRPTEEISATWELIGPDGAVALTSEHPLAPGTRTSEWPRYTWVVSPLTLDLPDQTPQGRYRLSLTLHGGAGTEVSCGEIATVTVNARPRTFETPPLPYEQTAAFGETLRLLGYGLAQTSDRLEITLWWQAQNVPNQDYKRFIHLYDPAAERILAQDDAMPRDWQYPTGRWQAGEVVSETVILDLTGVPEGTYRLGVGWYDPTTLVRLPAQDTEQAIVVEDRVTLNATVDR